MDAEAKRVALVYLERSRYDDTERQAIEKHGGIRTTAQVVSVRKVAELAPDPSMADVDFAHPPQEWAIYANIRTADGSTFGAELPLFAEEIVDPPAIGEVVHVVYDPSNHARVRLLLQWKGPTGRHGVRWIVPPHCPNCGAPVDQSTAIYEPHPVCGNCRAPLPVQPAP